jgi:D-alanyl-D-alanine dipeptidase
MSVTFKCNKTGNTVTFKSQYDIESMREHPEYTEVEQQQQQQEVKPAGQRGRPRKDAHVVDSETDSI